MGNPISNNRHVAVIGGSTGIGLAAAQRFVERGDRVTIGGRDSERLAAALAVLGENAQAIAVDATDADSLRRFYAEAKAIDDLIITVTRRGGAGPAAGLADADLPGAFAGRRSPTWSQSRWRCQRSRPAARSHS